MKNLFLIFIVVCCWTLWESCASSGDPSDDEAIVIPYIDQKPESLAADRYFSDITIVPLETNDECLLSEVQQVEFRDSLVFLCCDHDRLFLFHENGKFISQIGRKGRGSGEFIGFRGFFVDMDNQTVTIIDPMKKLLLTYAFDGTYRSSTDIPSESYDWGYFAMPVEEDKAFIFNSHNPGNNMAYTLMDRNDPERATYFCTYDPVKIENYNYHFATHPITRSGKSIHFTMPLDDRIYEYSNGEVFAKYSIGTPSETIPKDVMQRTEGSYLTKLVDLTTDRYFGGFTDIFETDNYIFLHYMARRAYPGLYVLDKRILAGSYHVFPSLDEKFVSPVFPFSASDGNRVVSVVPMREMMMLKNYFAENEAGRQGAVSVGLLDAMDRMNETDNPVLVLYRLK